MTMTAAEYRQKAEQLLTSRHHDDLPPRIIEQAAVWAQLATAAAIEQAQAPAGETEYVLELLDEDGAWMLRGDYDDRQAAVEAMERETAAQFRPHQVVERSVIATTDHPAS